MSALAAVKAPAILPIAPGVAAPTVEPPQHEPEQPIVVECPAWCERGDEHDDADDLEHWTDERYIAGDMLSASLVTYGGCALFEVRLGEHTKLKLQAHEAGKFLSVLAELLALSTQTWKTKTMLPVDHEATR